MKDPRESNINDTMRAFAETFKAKGGNSPGLSDVFNHVRDEIHAPARAKYLMKLCGGILTALVKKGVLTKEEAQEIVATARREATE